MIKDRLKLKMVPFHNIYVFTQAKDGLIGNNKIKLGMHYSFKSTPTYTFKSRTQTITKSNQLQPSPSDYVVKKPLHHAPTFAQVKQVRKVFEGANPNPSPGHYESKSYITSGPKRSMSARHFNQVKQSPGPTDYDTNTLKVLAKSPVFTMGPRSKSFHQIIFNSNEYKPAPGSYENKSAFTTKHGPFIEVAKRKDLTETEHTPAPNQYWTEKAADYTSKNNPRCKIGGQRRKTEFNQGEETPGPAMYEKRAFVEENKQSKRGYSCRQRTVDLVALELSKLPGPGDYERHLKMKTTAPRCALVQTQRKTFMDEAPKATPGPGEHELPLKGTKYRSTSANCFSKSARRPLDENERTPGPVTYQNDKINLLHCAPKFSPTKTKGKQQFLGVNPETPGPADYNASLFLIKQKTQSYEMGHQQRPGFDKARFTPGPGFYNLRGKESGPGWGFGSTKRIAFTDQNNQGKDGNMYEIPSKVVDPPKYMKVESKIQYSPNKSHYRSTGFTHV